MSRPATASSRPRFAGGNPTYAEVAMGLGLHSPDPEPYEGTPLQSVYFLLDPELCRIKIGVTVDVKARVRQHERQRGRKLELLGTLKGGDRLEKAMHSRFAPLRAERGEWFSSEIAAEVLELLEAA